MDHRGITPVVTHPERNALLMTRIPEMVEWVRFGCLLQVTAQSFTGRFGKSAQAHCATLMEMNMVHFVASERARYRMASARPAPGTQTCDRRIRR